MNIDLSTALGLFSAIGGFLWWAARQLITATTNWNKVSENLAEQQKQMNAMLEQMKTDEATCQLHSNETREDIRELRQRLDTVEGQFVTRLELLSTLKRCEVFLTGIATWLNANVQSGTPIPTLDLTQGIIDQQAEQERQSHRRRRED